MFLLYLIQFNLSWHLVNRPTNKMWGKKQALIWSGPTGRTGDILHDILNGIIANVLNDVINDTINSIISYTIDDIC